MIAQIIGFYCLVVAGLQAVYLLSSAFKGRFKPKTTEGRFHRSFVWLSHSIFLAVALFASKQ